MNNPLVSIIIRTKGQCYVPWPSWCWKDTPISRTRYKSMYGKIPCSDYIYAEADDLCEDTFLKELLSCFEKEKDVVFAYCQSRQIDENGRVLSENYFEYTSDIDRGKWHKDYIRDGISEISDTLVVNNSIPNVSAVIFKKIDISPIANEIINFKIAGDWFFYIWLLKQGRIAYVSQSLNSHRRPVPLFSVGLGDKK